MPLLPYERENKQRKETIVRTALGIEAFTTAWEEGRAMTMEEAIAYALHEVDTEGKKS